MRAGRLRTVWDPGGRSTGARVTAGVYTGRGWMA